ncbi:hypothetical protein LCGC14_2117500 [marine sediment metagenome]|uniref:Uncharacterized protein n=1 Tax=marine sediment metagenome TaxID=412755 RepID=A0A0F9E591_9ZZZZ
MLKPYYKSSDACIIHGDCLEVLPRLASADAVVTDPPLRIKFHGQGLG